MKRHIAIVVVAVAACMVSGCATMGSSHGIATPWGVAGAHTFGIENNVAEPSAREVDALVARVLEDAGRADEREARVAAR